MKKIEAIIRPLRLEAVKTALAEAGLSGLTLSDVRGCGRAGGQRPDFFRGESYVLRLPLKVKLEMIVRDADVDEVISILLEQVRTGEEGDGKIFVLPMSRSAAHPNERRRRGGCCEPTPPRSYACGMTAYLPRDEAGWVPTSRPLNAAQSAACGA